VNQNRFSEPFFGQPCLLGGEVKATYLKGQRSDVILLAQNL